MNAFEHSIQDVESATQVPRKYIDRCYEIMPWLEAYRRKSPEMNKYCYSSAAISVFHKVKELKDQGLDRQQIRRRLEEMGMGVREEGGEEGRDEQGNTSESHPTPQTSAVLPGELLGEVKMLYERMLSEKEKRIEQAHETTEAVRTQLRLLLPDGKTPEQIRAELEERERQAREIAELRDKERTISEIAEELETIEGKWGKGRRRRELFARLASLRKLRS